MKKIILLALGMVFLTNCGDNKNANSNNVAVAPEKRESFAENPYFKSEVFLSESEGYKKRTLQNVEKNEYNTFLEVVEKIYNYDCNHCVEELKEKYKNEIESFEKNTKSKFYLYIGESDKYIYFTPINENCFKGNIVEIDIPNYTFLDYYTVKKPLLNFLLEN